MAEIRRLLQIIGLFCKRALLKRPYSANETYDFKEPSNRSHPIPTAYTQVRVIQAALRLFSQLCANNEVCVVEGRVCVPMGGGRGGAS